MALHGGGSSAISMALPRCEIASWNAERRSAWSPALPHHSMAASVRPDCVKWCASTSGSAAAVEAVAQNLGDAPMQHLPPALEKIFVGRILNKRVLEAIVGAGGEVLDE
jgi:hypothetical protein